MSEALRRSEKVLTKADKRLLTHILGVGSEAALSTRKLAEQLGLSRATVQASIARLNDRGFLETVPGSPIRASVHAVCALPPVPLVGGPILPVSVEKGGGPILPEHVEKEGGWPNFGPPVPGPILPAYAQVPGPILWESGPVFHSTSLHRARDTDTSLTSFKTVSVSTDTRALCKSPGEVAQFAAGLFGREQLDWKLRTDFDSLADEFLLPSGAVTHFLVEKWFEKLRSRYRMRSPGALYDFLKQDLPLWLRSAAGRETVQHYREWIQPAERRPPMMESQKNARAAAVGMM